MEAAAFTSRPHRCGDDEHAAGEQEDGRQLGESAEGGHSATLPGPE